MTLDRLSFAAGSSADAAGGEEEDDGDGCSRGEERGSAGPLQRPLCLPLQAGMFANRAPRSASPVEQTYDLLNVWKQS